ncbi:MAG: phage baseplate assembly protein gpV [Clostridium sp.]
MDNKLRNLVRIGQVSSVDETKCTIKVKFSDKDDMISDDIPYFSFEYNMPNIGDYVACIFLGNGLQSGFCLGKYYGEDNPPPVQDKDIYYKDFFGEASLQYDKNTKTLTIKAENIVIDGNLEVSGNIHSTGSIVDVTGNTNHHSHP